MQEMPKGNEGQKMTWNKNMDDAPRDGTIILVRGGIAHWYENWAYPKLSGWYTLTAVAWPGKPIQWPVTAWMPLPQPPEVEG